MTIKTLNGTQPHPSWGGWEKFLQSCDKRDEADGVIYYGKTNCNYVLFPCGLLVQNFGYHGEVLMRHVREQGSDVMKTQIVTEYEKVTQAGRELSETMSDLAAAFRDARQSMGEPNGS